MTWIEILLATIWGGLLIATTIYTLLGGKFVFFKSVPVNSTVFVYEGNSLERTLVNVTTHTVVGEKIVKVSDTLTIFGYSFTGLSPTIRFNPFSLKTQVKYVTTDNGETMKAEWSVKTDANGKEVLLQYLRNEIEFVFDFYNLEGGGSAGKSFRANLLGVTCVFFARDPEKVLKSGGNNLVVAYNHLLARVSRIVAPVRSYGELKTEPRDGDASIFSEMLGYNDDEQNQWSEFNKELFRATGFALMSIAGGDISTNRDLEKATELLQIKELEAVAGVAEAEGKKQAAIKLAEGQAAYTVEELKALKNSGASSLDKVIVGAKGIWGKKP